jgi:hypothetical protein
MKTLHPTETRKRVADARRKARSAVARQKGAPPKGQKLAAKQFVRSVKQVVTTIGPMRLLASLPAAVMAALAYRTLRRRKR